MKYIKWLIFNGVFAFIVYDGTVGVTPLTKNSANLIPFLVAFFFSIGIVAGILYLIMLAFHDEMDRDKMIEFRAKLYKKKKWWRIFDCSFDLVVSIWLAAFGFTWSAIFYLLHIPLLQFAIQMRHKLIDELESI